MFYITEKLSEHIGETPEGFLLCKDVPLTRIGEFEYLAREVPVEGGMDGKVKIERDEDEVFAINTIASFEGKPITINHPDEMVTPENWSELAHGHIQNVRRGEGEQSDLLLGDLLITTEEAIELVKSGLREVSLGYDAEYEQIEKGKGRQRNIIGNHVALVVKGRAGGRCAIQDSKVCSGCGQCTCGNKTLKQEEMKNMKASELFKRFFPKSKFFDSIKDEDLGEVSPEASLTGSDLEKAQAAAAEAKEAAEKAVAAAQEASQAAQSVAEGDENQEKNIDEENLEEGANIEEENVEGASDLASVIARLDKLEALIQELISIETGEDEEGEIEGDADEEEEGWEEEFKDVASNAEIIDPDTVATKPAKDAAPRYFKTLKKTVLKNALTSDHAPIVKSLLKGKALDALKDEELSGLFLAASKLIGAARDSKVQKKTVTTTDYFKQGGSKAAEINARNRAFYAKK